MGLDALEYNCCLSENTAPGCQALKKEEQPDPIKTPACKNAMVSHCQTSANITSPMCRTFINNLLQEKLSDMDEPIIAFCATQREENNPFYKDCRCVNIDNTCLGQKIMRFKGGNPGCFYKPCKENSAFLTSSLALNTCQSVECTIGSISISGGDNAVINLDKGSSNVNCGNTELQPPRSAPKAKFFEHTSSVCTGKKIVNSAKTVPAATAKENCRDACIDDDDCNAYQTYCSGLGSTCECDLFHTSGFEVPKKDECSLAAIGNLSKDDRKVRECSSIAGAALNASAYLCADQRSPAAKGKDGALPYADSNAKPPEGYKAKSGSQACRCQGNKLGLDACGDLCCENSPYTSTDPTDELYFMNGGTKSAANLCWDKK